MNKTDFNCFFWFCFFKSKERVELFMVLKCLLLIVPWLCVHYHDVKASLTLNLVWF